jgi:membrane fusion protein (multidrug efflux system)
VFLKLQKFKLILAVIILLVSFFSWRQFFSAHPVLTQDVKVVEVEKVKLKNITQTIRLIGSVKARSSTTLTAQDAGILNIIIPSGAKVSKNTLIAKIYSNEVEKRYSLSSAAEIIAKEQFERAKNLLKSRAFSKNEFDKVHNAWIIVQKELAEAKIAFDKLQFYAPFDGIVGSYKIRQGAQIKRDEQIVSFYDPSNVTIEFDIPASAMSDVNNGQDLFILDKRYKLKSVQKMLDEEKHMSPASVDIICLDCLIGSNLNVDLVLKEKTQVIVIPFESVFLRNGEHMVYVIENDKAVLRNVKLGIRDKHNIEITSGLSEGEAVVITGASRLYPGVNVKVHQTLSQ